MMGAMLDISSETDVAIVGAGPIGIELAVALKEAGVCYEHVEAGSIAATIQWFAPYTQFFSSPERIAIAGVPIDNYRQEKLTREEYLSYLRAVVRQFELRIRSYERVVDILREDGRGFLLKTRASRHGVGGPAEAAHPGGAPFETARLREIRCRRLVLAIGGMHRPNLLGIEGEESEHVSHYLEEPHRYFGGRVLIAGGKNSAVEAALRLHRVGCEVHLSYRRPEIDRDEIKYWLYPELRYLIETQRVHFHPATVPARILPGAAVLASCCGGGQEIVECDFVLLLTGYLQDPALYKMAGVRLEEPGDKPVYDPATMETDVPNLYVAGTGAAGTQLGHVREFIETSHVHVQRIVAALTGRSLKVQSADQRFLET